MAGYLLLRHHSAVELVRAVRAGLIRRHPDPQDQRTVRLQITDDGADRRAALTALHRAELARLRLRLEPIWQGLGD